MTNGAEEFTFQFENHKSAALAAGALLDLGVPQGNLSLAFDPEQTETQLDAVHPSLWERLHHAFHLHADKQVAEAKAPLNATPQLHSHAHRARITIAAEGFDLQVRTLLSQYDAEQINP